MDTNTIMTVIGAVLGSSLLTTIVLTIVNRKKTEAETKQITISSEIELSTATLNYAKEMKETLADLKKDYNELKKEHEALEDRYANLEQRYDKIIEFLEKLGYEEKEILG